MFLFISIFNIKLATQKFKISVRNTNNLRYPDYTTLMTESEEKLKSLLMKVNEESEKAGLKFNIQKTKIMASSPITPCQTDGETMETVTDFIFLGSRITVDFFLGSKITVDGDCSHEIKRHLLLGIKVMTNLDIGLSEPSHPLSPSPPAPNPCQHQSLFQ